MLESAIEIELLALLLQVKKVKNTLSWLVKAKSMLQMWRELDQRERELDQLAEVMEELLHLKAEVAWAKSKVAEAVVELRKAKMRAVEALRPGGA